MLARSGLILPWSPLRTPERRRLTKARRDALIETTAAILKAGEPTVFAFEGACRHAVRSGLCLSGWSWGQADIAAADVVSRALNRLGAKRPTWLQGQPEAVWEGTLFSLRTQCVRCRRPLEGLRRLFCSQECATRTKNDRYAIDRRAELAAMQVAIRSAFRAKQPEKPCEHCGRMFRPGMANRAGKPRKTATRFCSTTCRNRHNARMRWRGPA